MSTVKPHQSPCAVALTHWRDTQVVLDSTGGFTTTGPALFTDDTLTYPAQSRMLRTLEKDAQLMRKPLRPWDTFSFSPEKMLRGVRTRMGVATRGELFTLIAIDVIQSPSQHISVAQRWCAFAAALHTGQTNILHHMPNGIPTQRTDVNIVARALDHAMSQAQFHVNHEALLLSSLLMVGADKVVDKYLSTTHTQKRKPLIREHIFSTLISLQQLQMDPATRNPQWEGKLPRLFEFYFREEKNPEGLLDCPIFVYIQSLTEKKVKPHDLYPTHPTFEGQPMTYQQHLMKTMGSNIETQGKRVNALFDAMLSLDMTLSPHYLNRLDVIFEFLPVLRTHMPLLSAVWAKNRLMDVAAPAFASTHSRPNM